MRSHERRNDLSLSRLCTTLFMVLGSSYVYVLRCKSNVLLPFLLSSYRRYQLHPERLGYPNENGGFNDPNDVAHYATGIRAFARCVFECEAWPRARAHYENGMSVRIPPLSVVFYRRILRFVNIPPNVRLPTENRHGARAGCTHIRCSALCHGCYADTCI